MNFLLIAAVFFTAGEEAGVGPTITSFIRGDANNDGLVNIADAVMVLNMLFGRPHPPIVCGDAADANNDGAITMRDPLYLLQFLFGNGAPPPYPFPNPGIDPGWDQLACGDAG